MEIVIIDGKVTSEPGEINTPQAKRARGIANFFPRPELLRDAVIVHDQDEHTTSIRFDTTAGPIRILLPVAQGFEFHFIHDSETGQRMIEAEMMLSELKSVVDELWPVKDSDHARAKTNQRQRWGAISNLFEHADTQAGIRGTRWAGYNALTEYANHVAPARGKTDADKAAARAERVISGAASDLMEKAFALTTV
ncbi:DUF932 domain-containing protein [Streptomyces sp. NPDC049541]|uniref:DUF932 domain-containing protein n=1 Tax=Streptomyces sp. NPDC049541 TaxID=3365594 RepID=UPI0037B0C83D